MANGPIKFRIQAKNWISKWKRNLIFLLEFPIHYTAKLFFNDLKFYVTAFYLMRIDGDNRIFLGGMSGMQACAED